MTSETNEFLEHLREELRLWPYTIHQIDDTLDSSLIEGRGKQLLFQALNSGMLTAFVGSGVSGAYGRMSWSQWQDQHLTLVKELSKLFLKLTKSATQLIETLIKLLTPPPDIKPEDNSLYADRRLVRRWLQQMLQLIGQARWEVEHLSYTFEGATSENGHFPGGEDLPVKFEIAKKLHDLLLRHRTLFLWPEEEYGKWSRQQRKSQTRAILFMGCRVDVSEGAPHSEIVNVLRAYLGRKTDPIHACHQDLALPKTQLKQFADDFWKYVKRAKRPEAGMPFETYAKTLLIDEVAHAESLLLKGLKGGIGTGQPEPDANEIGQLRRRLNTINKDCLRRDVDGLRDRPDRFGALAFFDLDKTVELLEELKGKHSDWNDLIKELIDELEKYDKDRSALQTARRFLTPSSRFLVSMILQLMENPKASLEAVYGSATPYGAQPLTSDSYESRRSIIADRFDPLDKTISKLKINRYLTTNYDFEIERQYLDRGFRRFDTQMASPWRTTGEHALNPKSYRTDGLGAVMKDITFKPETATDLLTFAAGGSGADASVFHLHGRATRDDRIVVTERDYMDMYLRQDPDRDVVDESILMAFAATPILFLGLGMNEADLLRPLRQFISDEDRAIGYRAIVLLPATEDYASRTKTSAGLYMRYGAHTVFFGGGYVKLDGDAAGKQPLDWLHRIMMLIRRLHEAVKARLDDLRELDPKESHLLLTKPLVTIGKLAKALGDLGPDLDVQKLPKDSNAFNILMGFSSPIPAKISPTDIDKLTVQDCYFTPKRGNWKTKDTDNQVNEGAKYTGFYTTMLTHLMRMALKPSGHQDLNQALRSLKAMETALSDLQGSFMTTTFNAALDSIEMEWRAWWKDWQESPPHREARFEEVMPYRSEQDTAPDDIDACPHRDSIILPRRLVRHRVISVITNLIHCLGKTAGPVVIDHDKQRAYDDLRALTRVRVFDTFIYGVAAAAQEHAHSEGRLMHTIAAKRGQGKGAFFSVFNTPLGLTSYMRAAHPTVGTGEDCPAIVTACFVNLSFAPEVASIYEMLEQMLLETVARLKVLEDLKKVDDIAGFGLGASARVLEMVMGGVRKEPATVASKTFFEEVDELEKKQIKALQKTLKTLTRAERFCSLMKKFYVQAKAFSKKNCLGLRIKPRLMLCINAVELLYDLGNRPKNLEIADFLTWLMSKDAQKLPFDLVIIGDQNNVGHPLTLKKPMKRRMISRSQQRERVSAAIYRTGKALDIPVVDSAKGLDPANTNFVHSARPIEPRDFLVDNFLPLACALHLGRLCRDKNETALDLSEDDKFNKKIIEARSRLSKTRVKMWQANEVPDVNHLYMTSRDVFEKEITGLVMSYKVPMQLQPQGPLIERVRETLRTTFEKDVDDGENLIGELDQQDWTNLQRALGGNRFCLTILLAAAQHLVFANKSFAQGGIEADTLLKGVVTRVRNSSISKTEEVVLETVMSVYRVTTKIGCADLDHELHMLLLRNIGVLGCPLSPNVIVRLPDMRDYFNRVQMEDQLSRRRTVARALAVLSERGLAFRISPHPKLLRLDKEIEVYRRQCAAAQKGDGNAENPPAEDTVAEAIKAKGDHYLPLLDAHRAFEQWPADLEFRYALHRQVQASCFKRLGHLSASQISANIFAPTLYASMPSRVVRLSSEGYLFLRRLMLGLSQYPDIRQEDAARDRSIFNDDNVITRVQALRAALSMVRGTFSVAAVSRFTNDTTGLDFARKRGYFETYKVRLRWILRKSWEIHNMREGEDPERFRVNALYRDEIIWLYNEVAVTCLVQGNLIDGIGHARQALHLNKEIEGERPGGRMHNMISLNIAIMQIDRGRLASAKRRLGEIIGSEDPKHRRVYHLAKGYRGLITHLQGNREDSAIEFRDAIKGLSYGEEDRARAILANHYAHLIAHSDPDAAAHEIDRAREYAESGGHEDIRSRIIVSEVWLRQLVQHNNQADANDDRGKLDKIQEYARMMGMDSLLVDTLHTQARMLLLAGDSSSSGRLMTRAMAVARRNSMNLRLNSLMTSYARVLMIRGRKDAARRLLDASLTMAKHHQFGLEVIRVHNAYEVD